MVRSSKFNGINVPSLGLGMMRLPCTDEKHECIDMEKAKEMVDFAMANGVNYFDTAWIYHNRTSEKATGELLAGYPRESYLLASKFPGMVSGTADRVQEIFETQLNNCAAEYFDFYLLHNVCENTMDIYMDDDKYHIVSYLLEQKKAGRIRHFGFSCHGSPGLMETFLERYGEFMEFGQIQLNYLDWRLQDARTKMKVLEKYNIPVWVMEPLRGGKLANLPENDMAELSNFRGEMSAVEWGFRFLQSLPQVKVVLSGMSDMEQLRENIRIFSEFRALDREEFNYLLDFADRQIEKAGVPCTECGYCTAYCPLKLNIPMLLAQYNEFRVTGGSWIPRMIVGKMPEASQPSACIKCSRCADVCPQQINIPSVMEEFATILSQKE